MRKSQIVVYVWPRGTLQVAVELSVWGAQVTGEATYVDDIPLPANTLYAAVVPSTRAHAKLLSVDASDAIKVITALDSGSPLGSACRLLDAKSWQKGWPHVWEKSGVGAARI